MAGLRHFYDQFWLKIKQSGLQGHVDAHSEHHLIDFQDEKIVLKDCAGKFGTAFFIWFGYKIDAPLLAFQKRPQGWALDAAACLPGRLGKVAAPKSPSEGRF